MFSLMPWRKERNGSRSLAGTDRGLSLFRSELEEMFDRFFARWPTVIEEGWMALSGVEVKESDETILIRTDAPGFDLGDFAIEVSGDTLTIAAEHTVEGAEKKPTIERSLRRVVTLPAAVDPERVEARYRNGVLEISLPRAEPARHRKIEVTAG
jgi:HSP20 family protein